MQHYIPVLMNMYTDMVSQNEKRKDAYYTEKERLKSTGEKYPYVGFNEYVYSDTMLHSVITIINRLNNR